MKFSFKIYHIFFYFFGVIFIVNAIFIYLGIKSFPGEWEKKSYRKGINYQDKIDKFEAMEKLDFKFIFNYEQIINNEYLFKIDLTNNKFKDEIKNIKISFFKPANNKDDFIIELLSSEDNRNIFTNIKKFDNQAVWRGKIDFIDRNNNLIYSAKIDDIYI